MDAYPGTQADMTYSVQPAILLVASSESAMRDAERAAAASAFRVGGRLRLEEALERIERQGSAGAVWIEVDRDGGGAMDALLDAVARDVESERYAAVVSTRQEMLDAVAARMDAPGADIIVNASDADRVAALATIFTALGTPRGICDIAADRNAERLRQLSEEVGRIASTLARLSTGPGSARELPEAEPRGEIPPLSAETVDRVIRARRMRANYFSEELFADPAWDMLLDLLRAEIAQFRVPVSSLCIAAAVPATTALRWLKTMVAEGLFVRHADPHDGRRVFVELAPTASEALRRYFAKVGEVATI